MVQIVWLEEDKYVVETESNNIFKLFIIRIVEQKVSILKELTTIKAHKYMIQEQTKL